MQKKIKKDTKEKVATGFHIEIDRSGNGLSASVAGVYSIVDFSSENVVLRVKKGRVKIVGSTLELAVYENKIVEISGKISEVSFL